MPRRTFRCARPLCSYGRESPKTLTNPQNSSSSVCENNWWYLEYVLLLTQRRKLRITRLGTQAACNGIRSYARSIKLEIDMKHASQSIWSRPPAGDQWEAIESLAPRPCGRDSSTCDDKQQLDNDGGWPASRSYASKCVVSTWIGHSMGVIRDVRVIFRCFPFKILF